MADQQQRISIILKAFEHKILDEALENIVKTVERTGANVTGPIPLPTKRKVYTVLRSPHVYKPSREQFEYSIHKRSLVISSTPETIKALEKIDIPSGVEVKVEVL